MRRVAPQSARECQLPPCCRNTTRVERFSEGDYSSGGGGGDLRRFGLSVFAGTGGCTTVTGPPLMTAPIASGWSGCRVGFAPTGTRRLLTAHHQQRTSAHKRERSLVSHRLLFHKNDDRSIVSRHIPWRCPYRYSRASSPSLPDSPLRTLRCRSRSRSPNESSRTRRSRSAAPGRRR